MNFSNWGVLKILIVSTLIIYLCEAGGSLLGHSLAPIKVTAITRLTQISLLAWFLYIIPQGIEFAGLSNQKLVHGLKIGLIWSFVFGVIVSVATIILFFYHINPIKFIRSDLPEKSLCLFILTGGLIGPIAEELYFRGILYSFLRKFNIVVAMGITTLIFAFFHFSGNNLQIIQFVGGLVFVISFEYSKSLITPIIIHSLGNLAIFSISLFFQGF
jgi:membrane protease YdiL (CAAX protease family)